MDKKRENKNKVKSTHVVFTKKYATCPEVRLNGGTVSQKDEISWVSSRED